MKVLVAEDDLASGKFMQKLLSKYGEVVLARDGIAAVDEFVNAVSTNERFDLICMDIMMPKILGAGGYPGCGAEAWYTKRQAL